MTRSITTALLAPLLFLLPLGGCVDDLGQFCHDDGDCRAGLRCSGAPGVRGICTYAERAADLFVVRDGGPRDSLAEGSTPDAGIDGQLDLAGDGLATDTVVTDGRSDLPLDGAAPDAPADSAAADAPADSAAVDASSD